MTWAGRLRWFGLGVVAGVVLQVAPAASLIYVYSGATSWVHWVIFAWRDVARLWRFFFSVFF